MTYGSLFTGIGGIDLGLDSAGFRCRWQVENDPYAVKVLEKHWPGVKRYGDITAVRGEDLEPVGRTKRLGRLGNAVVPQIAEWIGGRILEFDKELTYG